MVCPICGHEWDAIAPVGIKGLPCPACGAFYNEPIWEAPPQEMPNDGAWITGRLIGDWENDTG